MTEDAEMMKNEVDRLMGQLQEQQSKLRVYLAERDRELGVTMELGDLEEGMKKVCYRCSILTRDASFSSFTWIFWFQNIPVHAPKFQVFFFFLHQAYLHVQIPSTGYV